MMQHIGPTEKFDLKNIQWESKKSPLAAYGCLTFFDKQFRILNQFFTHLLHVPIYVRLQIFIQLSQNFNEVMPY